MAQRTCAVDGCTMAYRARGYCGSHYNRFIRGGRWHANTDRPCAACGEPVSKPATVKRRAVCSYRCRYYITYGRWPASKELVLVGWSAVRRKTEPPTTVVPGRVGAFTEGSCVWCGDRFIDFSEGRSRRPTKCCSDDCARRRLNATRYEGQTSNWIVPRRRRRIYARDGWICRLCGDLVDKDLPCNDDWAASLDHIIPRSAGGDHSDANLRLAHRWCNAIRGDDTHYTAADLAAN